MIKSSPELSISSHSITAHAISLGLGDAVQQAHRDQKDLEAKLLKDTTKTKSAKQLFANEAASKRLKQIWDKLEKKQKEVTGGLYQLNTRLEKELTLQGTTDLLILQNYAAILKDMKPSEVLALGREDKDALRAVLLLPVMKLDKKFSQSRELFNEAAERSILADDYEKLEALREQQADVDKVEAGLVETLDAYSKASKQIREKIVDQSEMPELG